MEICFRGEIVRASKSRLIFWPIFGALIMFILYQKRSDIIAKEWISYCVFVAGGIFGFIWAADELKPERLLAAMFGLGCCAGLYATTLSDRLAVAFFSAGITLSVWV